MPAVYTAAQTLPQAHACELWPKLPHSCAIATCARGSWPAAFFTRPLTLPHPTPLHPSSGAWEPPASGWRGWGGNWEHGTEQCRERIGRSGERKPPTPSPDAALVWLSRVPAVSLAQHPVEEVLDLRTVWLWSVLGLWGGHPGSLWICNAVGRVTYMSGEHASGSGVGAGERDVQRSEPLSAGLRDSLLPARRPTLVPPSPPRSLAWALPGPRGGQGLELESRREFWGSEGPPLGGGLQREGVPGERKEE